MLAAQAAVVGGKPELAREYYTELAAHEESRFIGFRGLIAEQIANGKIKEATKTAEDLLTSAPKSKWLNGAVIDLAFKLQDWDRLERYLKKAEANKALTKQDLKDKFAVFYFVKATAARKENRFEDALWLVEKSIKYSPDFLPAILLNGSLLLSSGEFKKLKKLVLESWEATPHPDLAVFFERAIADYKPQKQLKLAEELYNKNPADYESVIFYAKALISHGKSADAAELLKKAAGFKTTKSICRLMAQIDDSKAWNNRLDTAEDDKCWYCAKTGARYGTWQIFSDSGEFNTIVWGFAPKLDSTTTNQFLAVI
jgi:HemY protein